LNHIAGYFLVEFLGSSLYEVFWVWEAIFAENVSPDESDDGAEKDSVDGPSHNALYINTGNSNDLLASCH
jgi:hypothetical protein